MSPNLAVEVLTERRLKLVEIKQSLIERYDKEISDIETALLQLTGSKVWETLPTERFDDENPDYIKSSIEEH